MDIAYKGTPRSKTGLLTVMLKEYVKNSKKWMKNFQQLKQDMEVDIDGMLVNEKEKNIFYFKKIFTF